MMVALTAIIFSYSDLVQLQCSTVYGTVFALLVHSLQKHRISDGNKTGKLKEKEGKYV